MQSLTRIFRRAGSRALRALEQWPAAAPAARSLRHAVAERRRAHAGKTEATLDAPVAPLGEIPYTAVDLRRERDPLPALYAAPELALANEHLCRATTASRSLVSAVSQALLYALVRNIRPAHVFEIGTYRAGTSEVICRALHANGGGVLHTADPFGRYRVPPIVARWPAPLRQRLRFYPVDSMAFFGEMLADPETRPDLVFVDGNHDYEYALFDIGCAARVLRPGGFVVIDNVSQSGPFLAARDFLAARPDWLECRVEDRRPDPAKAFDPARSIIPHTDFIVLRAPQVPSVGSRPTMFGELVLPGTGIEGVAVSLGRPVEAGVIRVECVLRGFSTTLPDVERFGEAARELSANDAGALLRLDLPLAVGPGYDAVRLEIWLVWSGASPLPLAGPPTPV